jgi:hypothetical protein
MTALTFQLQDWAFSRTGEQATAEAEAAPLPVLLRRRVGALGRRALAAAWRVMPEAAPRFVFSSRHGEYDRTLGLLDTLIAEGDVSPAEFGLSVHHALAGLLSIAKGNRRGHTAIAAGADSFGYGLLEAAACLAENPSEPVLLVHYDEPLPDLYDDAIEDDEREAAALALALTAGGGGLRLSIEAQPLERNESGRGLALAFVEFLRSGDEECRIPGGRMSWCCRRA